jgi:hypothetical protein
MLNIILMVFAFVCFCIAGAYPPDPPRTKLIAAGLAFWSLAIILGGVGLHFGH